MEAKHSWLRTPFGDGYRISAQAYRTQLTAEGLRVLLPQGHAVKQSPVSSIATIREDGSFDLTAIAQKLCHDRLRRLVLWEVLAVFLQSLVVLSLGLVLQELEFGLPTWLSLLGEAAEHPAWRSVPFALLIVLARFLQQVAKHRRVKIVEQASSALCAFLFRRATTSGAAAACSVAELLNAVPRLVEATAKGSRLQLAAPMLGLSLGFGLLLMTLGAMAPLLLLLQLLLLGLEVLLRKLTPRWKQEAMHLREQREAMSAAALAMEMGCASATVKLFAWESAVWARLQQLRKREKAALQRLQRLEVLASVARELGVFVPVAVALLLQWLVFGMSLWACFQALAACRMTAQQLRRAQQVLLTKIPQVNACLEQELERTAPKQGDRSTYKSARYAVAIDSMRFFWEEPQEVQALPPKPNGNTALQTVMQKAEKGVSSGLDLVDSVSDDASVAERARRSTNTSNRFDLKVLSLQVKRGSHVALVGATGSGKSTLLAGLVGGCQCEHWGDDREGGVSLSGRLAYAPQRPCVKLADCSIRENVLCGRSFDAQRYEQALTTSTLAEDLQRLSNGDSALVEELAGPGLAAMQVARALFAEAQILLLDDPFVEMDHDRGKRAVSSLVKKYKDRTMILATQNLSLLSPLDSIIVLRNGTVFEQGDYKTLSSMPTELSRLLLISNQKESRRREGHGLPCPCICYEVGPDPMRELYPMDELFGTFPSFGHPSKAPKRWVSALQAVAVHRPSSRTVKAEAAPPSWERLNRRGSLDLMMDALRDVSDVDAGEPGVTDALLRAPRASSSSKAPQTAGEEVSGDGLQDLAKHHEAGRTPGIQSLPEDEDVYEDDKFGQLLQSMDDEGGPLDRVENKVHRRLPSASAVPMVGASEAGGYAGYTADSPGESIDQRSPTSPEVPSDQRIPRPNSSPSGHVNSDRMPLPDDTAQWAPGDDAVGTLAPGSPESADGLRRRVPLADLEEKRPPSHLRPEGQHGAPAPQTLGKPREEDTLKRRRADKEDPRTQRMDVLEKALKEKNDKIAELEKQVAKSGNIEKKELLRGSSSSSFLEGRFGHAPGRSSSRRGRGLSVLLLGRVGCSFWMLVLLVLVSTGIQLAVPVVLSYIFAPTWRMSTTAEPTISIPSPSIATEPTTETTSTTASETSGVAVPTFPSDVVVDDSEVVWRGFATSTAPASTTTTTTTTTTLASTEAEIEQDWSIKLQGHFCHEPNLAQETRPQGIYDLDPTIGWHWASTLSLQACKKACEDLIAWGCRFISWGGPVAPKRWCYVHQQCAEVMNVHFYQVFEMNMTDGSRRLQRHGDEAQDAQGGQGDGGSLPKIFSRPMVPVLPGPRRAFVTDETDLPAWLSTNSLEAALAGLCLFLPLLSVSQARLAADVGMQASQQNAEKQMKAVLSAAGDLGGASMFWAEGSLFPQAADMVPLRERPSLLKDVADADEFLPLPLARGLAAAAQVLAALLCAAAASGRQAVLAVSLTIVLGLSIYLHRMRLPFLHQIRRIASVTEDAAALRLKHLAECYEVLRVHGRLQTLSDDYEALCHDRALVATAADAAGRWLYTRLHCCVSLLVGLLCFSTLTQAPTALPSRMGLAVSIAALVQVAVLPDAVVELVKYGGLSTHGLAALRRMYQLVKETQSEELESPIFSVSRGELPTDRRGLGQPIHRARSGKVALGDLMVDNELPEDVIKSKKEQSFSVVGFPVEKVPADWPYFGAVEFEDVTVRYSTELSPSVSECSLRVPAGKALLVVGEESCGKSTLLRTLLRLAPETQEAGRVLVDGIDTRSVGLSTLRGRVAVVPQELVLYRGTWLQNLDPMEEFSEEEVQMVLRLTRFENWMLRHAPDGLHQTLEEGGAPHGAAAVLLGVSRAMLRLLQKRSKLLLMDATTCRLSASSDADLTALVLRYCRRAAVAVMQVSRRVQQAPLYDEVAVMTLGRILEQGPAKKLWVKDGALRRMAKEQGLDSAKMTKADALSARLGSVWGWEVSPQESPAWQDEFTVGMKKVKAEKEKKDSR